MWVTVSSPFLQDIVMWRLKRAVHIPSDLQQYLGGGFKDFLVSPLLGEASHFD